jgi:membrane-bound metal-dependent hydrolase YbcI (DUF457 family)
MPDWRKHLMGGCFVLAMILAALAYNAHSITNTQVLWGIIIFFIACLLPDIDIPSSKIRKIVEVIFLAVACVLIIKGMNESSWLYTLGGLILVVLTIILWFLTHRGIMHNPLIGGFIGVLIGTQDPILGMAFVAGFTNHLIMDALL